MRLTFDLVSTFTSAVMLLFLNDVLTSPENPSPLFTPVEVKACKSEECVSNKPLSSLQSMQMSRKRVHPYSPVTIFDKTLTDRE